MSLVVLTREVETGELSKVPESRSVVCSGGVNFIIKQTDMDLGVFEVDFTNPFLHWLKPRNSFVSRFVVFCKFLVSSILRVIAWTKVEFCIIQSVSIEMIYIFLARLYESVKKNKSICSVGVTTHPSSINVFSFFRWNRKPMPFVNPLKILSIYDGVVSSRERNKFDRLILRLDNIVTLHGAFHKEPSFLVRLSAALLYFTPLEAQYGLR